MATNPDLSKGLNELTVKVTDLNKSVATLSVTFSTVANNIAQMVTGLEAVAKKIEDIDTGTNKANTGLVTYHEGWKKAGDVIQAVFSSVMHLQPLLMNAMQFEQKAVTLSRASVGGDRGSIDQIYRDLTNLQSSLQYSGNPLFKGLTNDEMFETEESYLRRAGTREAKTGLQATVGVTNLLTASKELSLRSNIPTAESAEMIMKLDQAFGTGLGSNTQAFAKRLGQIKQASTLSTKEFAAQVNQLQKLAYTYGLVGQKATEFMDKQLTLSQSLVATGMSNENAARISANVGGDPYSSKAFMWRQILGITDPTDKAGMLQGIVDFLNTRFPGIATDPNKSLAFLRIGQITEGLDLQGSLGLGPADIMKFLSDPAALKEAMAKVQTHQESIAKTGETPTSQVEYAAGTFARWASIAASQFKNLAGEVEKVIDIINKLQQAANNVLSWLPGWMKSMPALIAGGLSTALVGTFAKWYVQGQIMGTAGGAATGVAGAALASTVGFVAATVVGGAALGLLINSTHNYLKQQFPAYKKFMEGANTVLFGGNVDNPNSTQFNWDRDEGFFGFLKRKGEINRIAELRAKGATEGARGITTPPEGTSKTTASSSGTSNSELDKLNPEFLMYGSLLGLQPSPNQINAKHKIPHGMDAVDFSTKGLSPEQSLAKAAALRQQGIFAVYETKDKAFADKYASMGAVYNPDPDMTGPHIHAQVNPFTSSQAGYLKANEEAQEAKLKMAAAPSPTQVIIDNATVRDPDAHKILKDILAALRTIPVKNMAQGAPA